MRTIIFLVIFALSVVPLVLAAQSPGPVRRIGFLAAGSQAVITSSPRFAAFSQGLRDLGWMEGQNLVMETRYAEGTEARLPELAADLVNRQVEVLVVTGGASAIRAAQHATDTIPIVGVIMGDPVGDGLVASLARPGGNLTGISGTPWDMAGKRLELLKAAVPGVTRVTVLANPAHQPSSARQVHETQVAAHALGLQLHILELRSADAFEGAFAALTPAGVEALVVLTDPYLFERHVSVITTLARQHRLPTIYPRRFYTDAGGLMSYSINSTDAYRRGATYVDKILKGAKPTDLPVEQPIKFEFVINLKAAQALDLTIPPSLLFQADEVIR